MTITFDDVKSVMGFDIVLPSYTPPELIPPRQAQLFITDGAALQVAIGYQPEESAQSLDAMLIIQSAHTPKDFGIDPQPTYVKGVEVFTSKGPTWIVANWTEGAIFFDVTLYGKEEGDISLVRDELLRVVASMIDTRTAARNADAILVAGFETTP